MTKQELMETYTAEQLADMVVELNEKDEQSQKIYDALQEDYEKIHKEYKKMKKENNSDSGENDFRDEINFLQSKVEKYRKVFEDAKKERDCQIAKYQNRVDKDKSELERAKNTINNIDDILEKLFGVRHDTVDKPDEFEKILSDKLKENATDFLPTEPIKVADMLINTKGEYEHNPLAKALCGKDKGTYRIFDISELRQIAEHLLVYCNHNGEVEE